MASRWLPVGERGKRKRPEPRCKKRVQQPCCRPTPGFRSLSSYSTGSYVAGVTLRENLQQGAQETSSSADEQAAVEISGYPAAEVRSRKSAIRILLNAIYMVNLSLLNRVDRRRGCGFCWGEGRRKGRQPVANKGVWQSHQSPPGNQPLQNHFTGSYRLLL